MHLQLLFRNEEVWKKGRKIEVCPALITRENKKCTGTCKENYFEKVYIKIMCEV